MKKIIKQVSELQLITVLFLLLSFQLVSPSTLSLDVNPALSSEKGEDVIQAQENSKVLLYHELPIYGNASLGYYYVKVFVGSPNPQPQSVIIDTGSGLLAVPGADCKKCSHSHIDPPFDPSKSQSSLHLTCASSNPACEKKCSTRDPNEKCKFSISYAEGSSLEGFIVEDDIRFQTYSRNQQIRSTFGYTNKETNYFLTQKANGIFGLAPRRQTDLLEKMVEKHSPKSGEKLKFSLCLSSNGGIMTVGGINQKLHKDRTTPTIVIPYNDRQNLYSLNGVKQISIEEELIHLPGDGFGTYGIFIDSGSTFSYFPKNRFSILESKLNKTCYKSGVCEAGRGQDSTCYKMKLVPGESLDSLVEQLFPPIEFYIQDQKIYWNSTKYMLVRSSNEVCLGILGFDRYLLGANWMYNRDIVFDLQQKNIQIYDNISCQKSSDSMGRYLSNQQMKGTLEFNHQPQLRINMESYMFWIGVTSLFIALVILIMLKCGLCEEKKWRRVRSQAESVNSDPEIQIIRENV